MRQGFRKGLALLLAGILLLAMTPAWLSAGADETGDVGGTTGGTTTFYVYASGSGSGYIRLLGTKGTAYISDYDFYGNFNGYKNEEAYGFFKVQVTASGYDKSYIWAPSASMSTYGIETSQSLVVVFPVSGDYKITVTPLTKAEVNGTYWTRDRLQSWTKQASWVVNKAVNCQCTPGSGGGQSPTPTGNPGGDSGSQTANQVTVNCYDQAGNYIRSYNESVTYSRTIYPRSITGYTAVTSSGYYINWLNGICTPASVNFSYMKDKTDATVTVYCYDTNGSYIKYYTESISASKTIYPQAISGYKATSGGQYITYSNGTCSPATVTFRYEKENVSGTVTVYCYDTEGSYLRTYTETITASKTIYPQAVSGYVTPSGGQYITYSNGVCSPSTVTFRYQKEKTTGTVTVYCYDTNGSYLRSYTETIDGSKTIYPQAISGYNIISGGQYITFVNGVCSPSTVTFKYEKYPVSATVNVMCTDMNGTYLTGYTETITESRTIYPQTISGYNIASGGQYITFVNGTCTPSSVTFRYQKISPPATLNIDCYDQNGNYIRSYTETISESRTVYPQAISGYTASSGGQYVEYRDGTCQPSSISFSYTKNPTPATVTIRCIDNNGNVIRTNTESITASKTFNPPSISGYTTLSGSQQVMYRDGIADPSQIDFQYQPGSPVPPGSDPRVVYPVSWDTQFKPGTATAHDGANAVRVEKLPNLYDGNASTSFFWMIWNSEMGDNTPELTAYFNGASISTIAIRNGKTSSKKSYNRYARPRSYRVVVIDNSGNQYPIDIGVPDSFTQDYREFSLGGTYSDVNRVEIWVTDIKYGDGSGDGSDKNTMHISDIMFYQ